MKRIAFCLLTCWGMLQANGEEANWLTDLAKAQSIAKDQKKWVLMDFNGSDWCPPCKALRKNVLSSPEFMDYAKTNLVLVDVDFPTHKTQPEELKKANEELSKKYNVEAYPTIVILNSNGKELTKKEGYEGENAKSFIAELQKLKSKE